MVVTARQRGLDVVESDTLRYLAARPDNSLGGLMAAQVVEHLEPDYLLRFLKTAFDKLRPGAPVVVETINPACWLAFFSSYIRDVTHVRPLHPDTLEYLLQANGFGRVRIQYSAPVPAHMKMQAVAFPPELAQAAETINANAAILNNLMFTYLDYAAIAYRSRAVRCACSSGIPGRAWTRAPTTAASSMPASTMEPARSNRRCACGAARSSMSSARDTRCRTNGWAS
jgi:hypothetical protein